MEWKEEDKLDTDDHNVLIDGEESVGLMVNGMIQKLKSVDAREAARSIVYNCNINNEILISRLVTQLYDNHDTSITQNMTDCLFSVAMSAVLCYTLSHPHKDVTSCRQYQLLTALIAKHDCSRQTVGWWGWWRYPIQMSVVRGVLPVTKLLLTKPEVSLDVYDEDKRSVLHLAMWHRNNNVDMTKYLLGLPNLKCLNHKDREGHTPYWWAENYSNVPHRQELIKLYKDNGAICK